jgi:Cof subfamily protein (haloacid dehalogenase superfamily)
MQNSSYKKILFSDIDETLVTTDKRLTDENRAAINEFLNAGNVLAITTGRALSGALNLIRTLELFSKRNTYLCAYNGAQIYDLFSGKTLYRKGLDTELVRQVDQYAKEYGIHLQAYSDTAVLSESDNSNLRRYCSEQNLQFEIVPDLAFSLSVPTAKLLAIDFSNPERVSSFSSLLRQKMGSQLNIFLSNEYLLEIVPNGIDKGFAVSFLAKELSVPIENTISAGDQENDIPMIIAAGHGCAVSNGIQALKDAADYVTEHDNNHSAIAEILRKFG